MTQDDTKDSSTSAAPDGAASAGGDGHPVAAPLQDAAPAPDASDEPQGLDPQLIALCVVLWVVAVGILWAKWDGLRTDWYLGNVKEMLDEQNRADEESALALIEIARGDPDVITHLANEVVGPLPNRDERYRIVILRLVLEKVPGPEAFQALQQSLADPDERVRVNAYLALAARARGDAGERERTVELFRRALRPDGEPAPMARSFVARAAALELGLKDAVWDVIRDLRRSRGADLEQARRNYVEAWRAMTGVDEATQPFDVAATPEVHDQQSQALEAWFRGQGGVVPAGESFAEDQAAIEAARRAAAQEGAAAPGGDPAPQGPVEAPGEAAALPQDSAPRSPGN